MQAEFQILPFIRKLNCLIESVPLSAAQDQGTAPKAPS